MKKIQTTILICFLALTTLMVGCKKDEVTVSNTEAKTMLTKKWYYYSLQEKTTTTGALVFERSSFKSFDILEFKSDNGIVDSYFERTGTFTLSTDGKTATATFVRNSVSTIYNFNITKLTETSLELNYVEGSKTVYLTFGSTAR